MHFNFGQQTLKKMQEFTVSLQSGEANPATRVCTDHILGVCEFELVYHHYAMHNKLRTTQVKRNNIK